MTDSAAGRPVLTDEQKLELNYLKLTWDRFYTLTIEGTRWCAIPRGTGTALYADNKTEMDKVLMLDAAGRGAQRGHFIERASGPPYWVPHRDLSEQARRSC
jgi:hypothetical protein